MNLTRKDDPAGQNNSRGGMLQYGELVALGGGAVKIRWMSTRCGEALDNSTGVFITTGFLWDSVPSEFEPLVIIIIKKNTSPTQNLSWGLFWIIYNWRPIEATIQWSKRGRYILNQLIKANESRWVLIGGQKWISASFMQFDWKKSGE